MRRPEAATLRKARPASEAAPDTASSVDAEIADLTATRAGLAEQLPPLERTKQAALLERRNLILGKADEKAIAEANRICREAESEWFAISDAMEEAGRRLADAIARRDAEAMEAKRQAVAGRLDRNASEIETAAAGLAKAIESVSLAYTRLAIGITGPAAGQFDPTLGVASPMQVANVLLYGGLAHALPSLDLQAERKPWSMYAHTAKVEGAEPVEAAAAFAERIRDAAAKVRSQEIGHDLPTHQEAMPDFEPEAPETEIFVLAPFFYADRRGDRRIVSDAQTSVPVPVAERAIEMGVASAAPTSAWRAKYRNPDRGNLRSAGSEVRWADCADLDLDLSVIRRAESDRLRGEWLERQAQAAA